MRHYVGFHVGKGAHWACVLDEEGEVILSRRIEATEEALEAACSEIAVLGVSDERVVGIDLTGGRATLLEAVLLGRGEQVRYIPGSVVNKAREAGRVSQRARLAQPRKPRVSLEPAKPVVE